MYNYPYYFQNMQQCNLNSSQFYRLQSQNVNCMQNVNDTFSNVQFNLQQQRIEDTRERYKDFLKGCFNCKHKIYGFQKGSCRMFDHCIDTDPFAPIRQCIYNDWAYWSPDDATAELMGVRRKIQEASQDVTISELKNNLELLRIQQLQTNIVATPKEPPKPEKKYTVYDMYDLVFPDDPIQAYFAGVYGRIEKECQEGIDFWDRVQVKPVECPVRALAESKEKPHTLEAVRDWLEFESYLVCGTAGAFPLVSTTVAVVFFFEGGLKDAAESVLLTGASFAAAFLVVSAVSFLRFLIMNGREG